MDTDDFSEMAYALIVRASLVSDTLKVELRVLSRNCSNEEGWLHAVQEYCREIPAHPAYVDYWNLEEEEGVTAARIRALALWNYARKRKMCCWHLSINAAAESGERELLSWL